MVRRMRSHRDVIQAWASRRRLTDRLRSLGYCLGDTTVQRWADRGNIPGEWFLPVARAARCDGIKGVDVCVLARLAAHKPEPSTECAS